MSQHKHSLQALLVVMLGGAAILSSPNHARAAQSTACIGGCCICVTGATCDSNAAWDACMQGCDFPPSRCNDHDAWDCPEGNELDCS
jgi:hypothetical protein